MTNPTTPLQAVEHATQKMHDSAATMRAKRNQAIIDAIHAGCTKVSIARAAGLSRAQIYEIAANNINP